MLLRGSLTVAVVAGIPIRVHWTFAILLLWFLGSGWAQGGTALAGLTSAAFMLAVFFCVVLHELGHALTARRFGVRTRDITLLPIGGVASLERIPEKPGQELAIALAGPAVNVVIAAGLLAAVGLQDAATALQSVNRGDAFLTGFLAHLAGVNVILVLFNLIPAFPMDGGRVLRALLATRLGFARATRVAASIGQGFAVLMAIGGMFGSMPMLILVALFVWIAAGAEAAHAESRSAISGLPVAAAMMRRFTVLGVDDTLAAAASELLAGSQHDFPITGDGSRAGPVVGVLTRSDLVAALARGGLPTPIRDVMRPSCPLADPAEPLERAVEAMRAGGCPLVPVMSDGQLVGLVTLENVAELIAVRNAGVAIAG
jgi:Zn-dependent protease